jgi:hypothetical protein
MRAQIAIDGQRETGTCTGINQTPSPSDIQMTDEAMETQPLLLQMHTR